MEIFFIKALVKNNISEQIRRINTYNNNCSMKLKHEKNEAG